MSLDRHGNLRACPMCGYAARITKAVQVAVHYGGIEGSHHKAIVIDEMLRALLTDDDGDASEYDEVTTRARAALDGPGTNGRGIAGVVINGPGWFVVQQNPELRRYKVVCAVNPPPGTVSSHAEMGAALGEKGRLEKPPLTAADVAAQLMRAVRGEVPVRLVDPVQTWDYALAGNVNFMFGDWRFTIFNDCDSYDYVDSAAAPDGRTWEMPEWDMSWDADNPPVESHLVERDEYLEPGALDKLEAMLRAAR